MGGGGGLSGGETAELLTRLKKEEPVALLQGRGRMNE